MSRSTSFSGGISDRKSNKQYPSKVLLVCVYETIIFELTNEQIFDKFNLFGPITKILIFQKGEVTKFFIEFVQTQFAVNAKNKLDGTKFFQNICKMNIYFSNFRNVDLRHESSNGADYEMIEEKKTLFEQNFNHLSRSSIQKNVNYLDDDILMQTFFPFQASSSFTRSKTDDPRNLQTQIQKIKKEEQNENMFEQEEVDKQIKLEIHSLLLDTDNKNSQSQKSINSLTEREKYKCSAEGKRENSQSNSSVICYDLKESAPLIHIYNLFSNFGNIQSIIAKKHKVFIKYRSGYFAAVALNYLAGMSFCGNHLNLKYCQNLLELEQKTFQYSESIYFDQTSDRFTSKRSITVNPPSETLHVSSIKKENCNEVSLRKVFGQFGCVQKVKILMQSYEKNMALVKFSTMKESFQAISELHNKYFGGRKMQISFTKSKL